MKKITYYIQLLLIACQLFCLGYLTAAIKYEKRDIEKDRAEWNETQRSK